MRDLVAGQRSGVNGFLARQVVGRPSGMFPTVKRRAPRGQAKRRAMQLPRPTTTVPLTSDERPRARVRAARIDGAFITPPEA